MALAFPMRGISRKAWAALPLFPFPLLTLASDWHHARSAAANRTGERVRAFAVLPSRVAFQPMPETAKPIHRLSGEIVKLAKVGLSKECYHD